MTSFVHLLQGSEIYSSYCFLFLKELKCCLTVSAALTRIRTPALPCFVLMWVSPANAHTSAYASMAPVWALAGSFHNKKDDHFWSSFWRRYFCYLLGVAKLYNVLGGVTSIIITLGHPKVCIKFRYIQNFFCAYYT